MRVGALAELAEASVTQRQGPRSRRIFVLYLNNQTFIGEAGDELAELRGPSLCWPIRAGQDAAVLGVAGSIIPKVRTLLPFDPPG